MLIKKVDQPMKKSRFKVSKVAGPPNHSNVIVNQQQVADIARSQLQQTEELKISERQNILSHHTDDLHGRRISFKQQKFSKN